MADGCEAEMQEEKSTQVGIQTGLKDAFKVVSLASRERLQSLTFKMGSSEAEVLVHAMCLIHLKKRQEALCKLESLPGNSIAKYLADRVKTCHESLVDFKTDSLHSPESQEDALIELARIFRVLAKERLCSESQRDEAYRLALWVSKSNVAGKEEWGSHRAKELMKEAKEACGPCVVTTGSAEVSYPGGRTLTSSSEHCSVFLSGKRDLDRRSTAIPIQNSQCGSSEKGAERSSPSSLRTSSPNGMSFPSHLEVSVSPTTEFDPQRINRDMQDLKLISSQVPSDISTYPIVPGSKTVLPSLKAEEYARESVSTVSAPGSRLPIRHLSPQPPATPFVPGTENYETSSSLASKNSDPKTQLSMGSSLNQTSKTSAPAFSSDFKMKAETQTNEKRFSDISVAVPHENKCEVDKDQEDDEDEEEPVFFSFVIFHAPEDEDTAMELQEKLEGIGIGEGATFSQDFEIPGKSKITCVEDAIDNSAFTILLLSRNFKNQLLEFQTNSALMNSIEKRHKYNSVIPLLPSKNCMPQENIPRPLRIYVPLKEKNRSFVKVVKKIFAPEVIRKQKQLWSQDLLIRKQQEKQDRLREKIERNNILALEINNTSQLQQTRRMQEWQIRKGVPYSATVPFPIPAAPYATGCPPVHIPAMPQQPFYSTDWPFGTNGPLGQQPSIHIENASCIMFGNNSQMTVGAGAENCGWDEELDESNNIEERPNKTTE